MELSLQPQAAACFLTQRPFTEGERVVCHLVRVKTGELMRYDVAETAVGEYAPEGSVACRWVRVFKPRKAGENPDRELRLTAENLFFSLVDPSTELTPESTRLVQFLALMLERKRVLRPKGLGSDGKQHFEHAKTKQMIAIPAGELSAEFFVQVQEQLEVLIAK